MRYFDYAATTPTAPEAADEMAFWLRNNTANASALYAPGREAREAVETARARVAALTGADAENVIFTSGGTEADNTALFSGAAWGKRSGRDRIIVSAIEHHAVLDTAEFLKNLGVKVTVLPVDPAGRVEAGTLRAAMGEDVALVSVMWVNNELGTVQDVTELGEIAHAYGALFHTDAVQALTTQDVDLKKSGADMISVSSHKIYGPKGCGALIARERGRITPLLHGGQQENGLRGGTENVAAIAGFGKAAEIEKKLHSAAMENMRRCRAYMLEKLSGPSIRINSPLDGAPSILNVAFENVEAEGMLFFLDRAGICVSMGSACTSRSVEPSHVIRAIAVPESYARGCIRLSFGRGSTLEDCAFAAEKLLALAGELRA